MKVDPLKQLAADALIGYIISPQKCFEDCECNYQYVQNMARCVEVYVCACLSLRVQSEASHLETELQRTFINKYRLLASSNRATITSDQANCTRTRPFPSSSFTLRDTQHHTDQPNLPVHNNKKKTKKHQTQ